MATFKIFGKDKKEKETPVVAEQSADAPKASAQAGQYIIRPHITEKATDLAHKNQYVFVVDDKATKKEIEKSAAKTYGVEVVGVRIVHTRPKSVRLGRYRGTKKGYKKAIVQVKEGQSIEILPA